MNFEEIYEFYFKDIYYFLLGLSSDSNITEELTQDTFFKAFNNLDSYKPNKDIRAWLFTIARNNYYTYYRINKKKVNMPSEQIYLEENNDIHFVKNIVDKDLAIDIHKFIHTMEDPYKEVFYLRVFGELSYKDIGKIFSKTDSWARVVFFRSRKQIIKWMEERGDLND